MSTIAPIIGLDNKSPLYNPDGMFHIWNKNEIYLGNVGESKYVPKVGDLVVEVIGNTITWYIVRNIDAVTYVPVLVAQDVSRDTPDMTTDDILYGVGPGTQSDTYRIYVDKSVVPYRLSVDRRLFVGGSTCSYCKLYKGADVSPTGIVVSGIYSSSGVLQSDSIPLEVVRADTELKVVSTCFSAAELFNGELVTAVFFDTNGVVVSKRQLLVEESGFIRGTEASTKYVSSIALDSPFLSTMNNKLLMYPMNVPLNTMNVTAIITYSDGSNVRKAIDGVNVSLFGLDNYTATIVGQRAELVLKYKLAPNEEALDVHLGTDNFISEVYDIETYNTDGHYAVQLFGYPIWSNANHTYTLKWYMYDLNRSSFYDVTNNVIINTNRSSFVPNAYGTKQTLTVSINLATVNGSYKTFNHVQMVSFTLNKPGSGRPSLDNIPNWVVDVVADGGMTYGYNTHSTYRLIGPSKSTIRIAPMFTTQEDWLKGMYLNTQPMLDSTVETTVPTPTHFFMVINGVSHEYPINKWNTGLVVNQTVTSNDTIYVRFIKRTNTKDLQLCTAATQVFQADINGNFIFV